MFKFTIYNAAVSLDLEIQRTKPGVKLQTTSHTSFWAGRINLISEHRERGESQRHSKNVTYEYATVNISQKRPSKFFGTGDIIHQQKAGEWNG